MFSRILIAYCKQFSHITVGTLLLTLNTPLCQKLDHEPMVILFVLMLYARNNMFILSFVFWIYKKMELFF